MVSVIRNCSWVYLAVCSGAAGRAMTAAAVLATREGPISIVVDDVSLFVYLDGMVHMQSSCASSGLHNPPGDGKDRAGERHDSIHGRERGSSVDADCTRSCHCRGIRQKKSSCLATRKRHTQPGCSKSLKTIFFKRLIRKTVHQCKKNRTQL